MNFWHAFTVAPNKERPAAQRLGERGVLANVPLIKRQIRIADGNGGRKRVSEFVPAWTGYVFIYMPDDWREIERVRAVEFSNGDRCVRNIVAVGGGKITEEAMKWGLQQLKLISEASSVKHSVKVGDTVRVKNGAFAGQIVKVGSVEGTRACILMEMFKQSTPALVSIHNLELATAEEKTPMRAGDPLHCGANQSTRYPRDVGRSATGGVSRQQEVPRAKWAR
jgi:transcription antitermination factor NusG